MTQHHVSGQSIMQPKMKITKFTLFSPLTSLAKAQVRAHLCMTFHGGLYFRINLASKHLTSSSRKGFIRTARYLEVERQWGRARSMKTMTITQLGEARHPSPVSFSVDDEIFTPADVQWPGGKVPEDLMLFEKAGPRKKLFFGPRQTRAAIVTCGGLCPGLNNVIRSVTRELFRGYGVKNVLGIRCGYRGLDPNRGKPALELTEDMVEDIHKEGGTMLGTSRGPEDMAVAVEFLISRQVDMLFCVGGDGTQRGGNERFEEARERGHALAVVGIPKTIDNDVPFVTRTFGFVTAVDEAVHAINSAHTEARNAHNGMAW